MNNKEKLDILYMVILVIEKNIIEYKKYIDNIYIDIFKINDEQYMYINEFNISYNRKLILQKMTKNREKYYIMTEEYNKNILKINEDIVEYNKLKRTINYIGFIYKKYDKIYDKKDDILSSDGWHLSSDTWD